ncbi:RES domain protein [Burkholderia gladioli]|nr:RES domain protein [Burkholderia gladioli]ASD80128.1 RES domain-containing protein [Burkholderia gladioli pv. gladioli]AWY54624.1 RES domain-containing protein [Burkholderia gladioli pv. gladioli]SQA87327.1 RES domain [Burkholderia gladioli]
MNDDGDDQKHICFQCTAESYLSTAIEKDGKPEECAYCGQMRVCISIEELADRIESAFDDHYICTPNQPTSWQQCLLSDRESDYEWEREGQPVLDAIEEAAVIPREAAEDVLEILDDRHGDFDAMTMGEETEFSSDTYYEEKSASAQGWHDEWRNFERSLKTEARFFSRSASELLARIFGSIDVLKTRPRHPLAVSAGPTRRLTHLYRARVFQSEDKLEEALCRPDMHLGSPPTQFANSGRMNARGISVFYGATSASVALAEVRPPVGCKVVVAKFAITRPLRLLDLTALDDVQDGGSIFDPSLKGRLERVAFLRSLGLLMTRAVMPNDEAFDYLATQAIADFLATENEPRFDGIIFRSAQSKRGSNVVLFHKAARVEAIELPKGAEIDVHTGYGTEDGWEIDYGVSEVVPKAKLPGQKDAMDSLTGSVPHLGLSYGGDDDYRETALRVDLASVEVHHVNSVKVYSTRFAVSRHRLEKREPEF